MKFPIPLNHGGMKPIHRAQHRKGIRMRSKIITIVLTITAMGIAGTMSYMSAAADSHKPAPVQSESSILAPPVYVPQTTTSSTTAPQLAPAVSIVRPALKASTTTTSEVPPRLTPEQEAKIPSAGEIDPSVPSTDAKIQWCINTHQDLGVCKLPESEGMGEDGTDYNLPNG